MENEKTEAQAPVQAEAPETQPKTKVLKLKEVKDDFTGKIWLSARQHNAIGFRNHEIVRIDADIMATLQEKDKKTNSINISAKEYVAQLIRDDLKIVVNADRLMCRLEENSQPIAQAQARPTATAQADTSNTELNEYQEEMRTALKEATTEPTEEQVLAKIDKLTISRANKNAMIKEFVPSMIKPKVIEKISF